MKNEIFISFHENFDPHMLREHFVYTLILSRFQRSKVGCCILVREREKPSEIASICKFCADLCRFQWAKCGRCGVFV